MKKKFLLTLVALVCALCCAFGFAACDGGGTKVKNEAHWKQAIADARKSDQIDFFARYWKDTDSADIEIKVSGNVQYLKMSMYTDETENTETWEYYYDGEYVYLNVKEQELGYDWQKIKADTVTEEFAEPISYIDKVYSGELLRELGYDVTFDDLDKLSNRYADAEYGAEGYDVYRITDADIMYNISFVLEKNIRLYVTIESEAKGLSLAHGMGNGVTLNIPTTSVQEVSDTSN